jgi:protein TonB
LPVDLINCPKPKYPEHARRSNQEGSTTVLFQVSEIGLVIDPIAVTSSGSEELDNASLEAIKSCAFRPKTINGKEIQSYGILKYKWKLEDPN